MQSSDLRSLNDEIKQASRFVDPLLDAISQVIVGQKPLLERLVLALLCEGHVLIEGLPGLAKTLTIKSLAQAIQLSFQRVQFTPDLLPSDLIGTMIYNPKTLEFFPKKGPLFAQLVLADEINRAPAKVQSALLEAMGERQVTLGETTYHLEEPFIVLATQNPIEQEGTYPLPEAQLDRFLFKILVDYPSIQDERVVLDRMSGVSLPKVGSVCEASEILTARGLASKVYMDEKIKEYILALVFATRDPKAYDLAPIAPWIQVGVSPRGSLALAKAARAKAFISHRAYVTPEDVKAIFFDALRHRLVLTFEAEAEGITRDQVLKHVLERVEIP